MGLALRRIAAWLIDWACIVGWVAVTALIGVPLYIKGVIVPGGLIVLNVIAGLVVVVPVVLAAAVCESSARGATPGKRALRLRVRHGGTGPGFGRALARNVLKIGIPWLIGHAAVYELSAAPSSGEPVPVAAWALTVAAYVLPIVYLACLFLPSGRTPYDRIAGTAVAGPGSGLRPER
jgi:uncharacterized RDD family membrane protein YckC